MGTYTNVSKTDIYSPGGALAAPGSLMDLSDKDLDHPVVKGWLDSKMIVEGDQRKKAEVKLPPVPQFAPVPPVATPLTPDPNAGPGAPGASASTQTQPGAAAAIIAATASSEQNAANEKDGTQDSTLRAAQDQTVVDRLNEQKAGAQPGSDESKAKADTEAADKAAADKAKAAATAEAEAKAKSDADKAADANSKKAGK